LRPTLPMNLSAATEPEQGSLATSVSIESHSDANDSDLAGLGQ
jgi:hypothetical protein